MKSWFQNMRLSVSLSLSPPHLPPPHTHTLRNEPPGGSNTKICNFVDYNIMVDTSYYLMAHPPLNVFSCGGRKWNSYCIDGSNKITNCSCIKSWQGDEGGVSNRPLPSPGMEDALLSSLPKAPRWRSFLFHTLTSLPIKESSQVCGPKAAWSVARAWNVKPTFKSLSFALSFLSPLYVWRWLVLPMTVANPWLDEM